MPTIYVEGQPYEVRDGLNLLQACLELGFDLPYFCWHPAMGSVGACRQCAVKQFKDENDTRGRIVMACMTPASQGTRISIADIEAQKFRESVTEWMMMSHPHDCPVCDEGGECHLQDMTVMTGHNYRGYRGFKRTFVNQDLGPLVNHEMNRCIQCYRCVRFYREYAGGKDLNSYMNRDQVYFGRHKDGVLESEFSGNLVEICPTGVFTDKTLKKHFTRKWDEQSAPSICVHCSLGCNTMPGERYGTLRRIRNRYNGEVNGYFLCDRGRYGYEFVNDQHRIHNSRQVSRTDPLSKVDVMNALKSMLGGDKKVIGIGSPRASLEANFSLRALVGPDHFYQGIPESVTHLVNEVLGILRNGSAGSASLKDVEKSDAVLLLGEDVTNTAPMLSLALRQSVRQKPVKMAGKARIAAWDDHSVREYLQGEKGPLYITALTDTRLDDVAKQTFHGSPEDQARLGYAVAHIIDPLAPEIQDLPDDLQVLANKIAEDLQSAESPLVVSGTGLGNLAVIQAAANVAWALCKTGHPAKIAFALPAVNSMGLAMIGGLPLERAIQEVEEQNIDTIVIVENDLYKEGKPEQIENLFSHADQVIVLDYLENRTTENAHLLLPAATFAKSQGTFVNNEGRAQRFFSVFVPAGDVQASWSWLQAFIELGTSQQNPAWQTHDELLEVISKDIPELRPILEIAPPSDFRIGGMKIPRESARYSGRTAMHANNNVSEPKPPQDPESPLSYTMEGSRLQPPSSLITEFWQPGWNSIQSLNKFQQEIGGSLRGGDPGKRLLAPPEQSETDYYPAPEQISSTYEGEWQFVPIYHIFGSEELSVHSPGIAQLSPQAYILLNPDDIASLGSESVTYRLDGIQQSLPVKSDAGLPSGLVGLPVGLPGLAALFPFGWGKLEPASSSAGWSSK